MWTSALGREHGATDFASKALGGLVFQEEEEEEEEENEEKQEEQADRMDESPDGEGAQDEEDELPMMPEPTSILLYSADKQFVEFPFARMARSCVTIAPGVLKGLYAIQDLTLAHKKAVCNVLALPLLVSASPAVAFAMRKTAKGARNRKPAAIQSWVLSAGSARQLVLAIAHGLVGFHASVKPAFLDEAMRRFTHQVNTYELTTFAAAVSAATTLDAFIAAAEAMGFYYLHACEEYVFRTIIEPHCGASISLAEVLTPHVTYALSHCTTADARATAQKCVADFFAMKSAGLAEKYSDPLPIRFPPQDLLYKELIPQQTLQDYWALCKYIYA